MPDILSIVSITGILELPWYVGIPGLVLTAMLLWSALWSILTLKPIRAITRLILAFAVLLILSQGGSAISQLVGGAPPGS